jgi:hypothetical protein
MLLGRNWWWTGGLRGGRRRDEGREERWGTLGLNFVESRYMPFFFIFLILERETPAFLATFIPELLHTR